MNQIPQISLRERMAGVPDPRLMHNFCALFPEDLCHVLEDAFQDGVYLRVLEDRILPLFPEQVPCLAKLIDQLPLDQPESAGLIYMLLIEPFTRNRQGGFS